MYSPSDIARWKHDILLALSNDPVMNETQLAERLELPVDQITILLGQLQAEGKVRISPTSAR